MKMTTSKLRVLLITTSYPLKNGPPSGSFVKRLAESISSFVNVTVLTPCFTDAEEGTQTIGLHIICFRYAPKRWQRLAHFPGGIPVALKSNPSL